jgi:hypothetical protein
MNEVDDVSTAEAVAAVISKTGTSGWAGLVKTITYRIPLADLSRVDAMAAEAGKSRNAMLNLLLSAGLDAVQKELPRKVAKAVGQRQVQAVAALLEGVQEATEE